MAGPGPPFGAPPGRGPPPPGWGHPPHEPPGTFRYEPFGAVPPPPGLDAGKGKKGKGKSDDPEARGLPEGLVLSNVPPELNSLDALNRHFRQFGEVLKITSSVAEGKAFIQFATRASAEGALSVPVLDRPDIAVAWSYRPKGKAGGKGGKNSDRPAENRVLCTDPEEQRKIVELKTKREELASRKTTLLANLTTQMKAIMSKLHDPNVSEEKREKLRTLLLGLKEKLDTLGVQGGKEYSRMQALPSAGRSNRLDNRSRALKFHLSKEGFSLEELREELRKLGVGDDQVVDLHLEPEDPAGGAGAAVVQFKERAIAEKVFGQKAELSATVEWLPPPVASEATARDDLSTLPDAAGTEEPEAVADGSTDAPTAGDEATLPPAAEPADGGEAPAPVAAEGEPPDEALADTLPATDAGEAVPEPAAETAAAELPSAMDSLAEEQAAPAAVAADPQEVPPTGETAAEAAAVAADPLAQVPDESVATAAPEVHPTPSFEETTVDFGGGGE